MSESACPAIDSAAATGPGRLILVVGPSGAGKDTLIGLAKVVCAGHPMIVFPRRVVTRAASASEDNEYLDPAAFRAARDRREFAICWDAHGHSYGLRCNIEDDIRSGRQVVINVSRTVIGDVRTRFANVTVVEITAPPAVLAERLAQRKRGSDGKIEQRLDRQVDEAFSADTTIINIGGPAEGAQRLIDVIRKSGSRD